MGAWGVFWVAFASVLVSACWAEAWERVNAARCKECGQVLDRKVLDPAKPRELKA